MGEFQESSNKPMLQILLLALAQGIQLDETVITAPRSAATVTSTTARRTVVDGERLRETGERSLPRALAKATGAAIQESNLGGGAPVLRGLLGGRILIVVDGVRLNDSTTRLGPNQSLAGIDPEIVDKVEILRGPASVLYGSDAIGGVILIWTRHRLPASRTAEEPLKMWDGAFRGTYDSSLGSPRVSLGLGTAYQDHGLMAVASGFDYEDYKAGGNEVVPNTGYNSQSLFGAYEYAMGKRETLRLTARVNRDFNVPRTDRMNVGFGQTVSSNQDYRYSLQDRRGYVLSYTDERSGELADLMQIRLSMNTYDEERDITAGDGSSSTFSRDETQTVGIGMDWQAGLGSDHLLTWGVDLAHDDVNSYREQTDGGGTSQVAGNFAPDAQYGRAGVFVQDELFAFDPLFLTMGLRYSVFDYSFGSFNSNASRGDHFSALTASLELARE
ncbi:MAG: hemoglobin/transferrin/lactoferrin receptor protein, partial [Candidatus Paceibacteria bacterium]